MWAVKFLNAVSALAGRYATGGDAWCWASRRGELQANAVAMMTGLTGVRGLLTSRRNLLAVSGAAAASLLAPRLARAGNSELAPPVARTVDVVDHRFGLTLPDPYRWMENPKDPEWLPFLHGQNAYARARLDAIPGRAALARRIDELTTELPFTRAVQRAGPHLFLEYRAPGANVYSLYVADAAGAGRRLLVDPGSVGTAGGHEAIDWWAASPDGAHVVFGISAGGSENSVLHVVCVADCGLLPVAIPGTQFTIPAWLPDSSGFFYQRVPSGAVPGTANWELDSEAWLHRLRDDFARDTKIMARGFDPAVSMQPIDVPYLITAPGSDFVVLASVAGVRPENALYTAKIADLLSGRPRWKRVCGPEDGIVTNQGDAFGVALSGGALFLIQRKGAPLGRLIRVDAGAPDLATARELMPEGKRPIETVAAARDALYVRLMDGGPQRLVRITYEGATEEIATPFDAGIDVLFASTDHDGVDMRMWGWLHSGSIWRYDPGQRTLIDTGLSGQPSVDTSRYEVTRLFAIARDGTRVPVSIVSAKGLARDGSATCLMNAYGAYQVSRTPIFRARDTVFLDAGGVLATAHVRGGGEYGRPWWEAGKGQNKHNTWEDAIACAEALCDAGWTAPARLTLVGNSAGGIMVGRAITERPDLFAGAVDGFGWVNPTRCEAEGNGASNMPEFGDPKVETDFHALAAMDAYQHIRNGVPYPAVLIIAGANDPRVAAWHSAKFAARLQKASASGRPVLLSVEFDGGHGVANTVAQTREQWADVFAFTLWRAGL